MEKNKRVKDSSDLLPLVTRHEIFIIIMIIVAIQCAVLCLVTQSRPALPNLMDCSRPGSSVHGDSPGKNTGVGCHALLQGTFPTQRSNSHLLPSPALAGGFFTISTTWEGQKRGRKIVLKHCWSKTPRYFLQFHRIHNKRCLK